MNLTSKLTKTHYFITNLLPADSKTKLMDSRALINKALILSVFVIAGFLLARGIYYGSLIGIILAVVAIAAWTYFLYQLGKAQEEQDPTEELFNS